MAFSLLNSWGSIVTQRISMSLNGSQCYLTDPIVTWHWSHCYCYKMTLLYDVRIMLDDTTWVSTILANKEDNKRCYKRTQFNMATIQRKLGSIAVRIAHADLVNHCNICILAQAYIYITVTFYFNNADLFLWSTRFFNPYLNDFVLFSYSENISKLLKQIFYKQNIIFPNTYYIDFR